MAASALSLQRLARSGLALAILLLALPAAGATAPAAGAPEGEDPDIPGIVLGSVVDGSTLEFQNPFTGSGVTIELPRWAPVNVLGMEMDFSITRHLVILWVAALLLIVGVNLAARKRSMVPKGFYSFIETFVVFVRDELAVKNIGKEHADRYVPFLCTAFFLILLLNLLGLVPYSATATGNIAVTAGLALCTFGMTLIAGMRGQGVAGFWLGIVPKGVPLWLYPIMVPVELLGLVTKPFALSVRLFANMSAGGIIIGFLLALIFMLGDAAAPFMAPVSVAFAAGIYLLKLFVAFLQAYIFTMLSALFIGMASHPH